MNLKDLNKIDIKDLQKIDLNEVKERVQSRPDLLINIALIVVTVFVIFSSFNKYKDVARTSKLQITKLKKRVDALEQFENVKKELSDFVKESPDAIAGDRFIQILSEIATRRNIQILSFSPTVRKSNKYIGLTSVEINIASENYADIILFVKDIEQSVHPIRINDLSSATITQSELLARSRRPPRRTTYDTTEKMFVKASITIDSVELKNV